MSPRILRLAWLVLLLGLLAGCGGRKKAPPLRLATTTSVQDSGLLATLLPRFEQRSGYQVEVTAVGSGKALDRIRAGSADVAITHAPEDEQRAVREGLAARRTPFMHNELVLVGPKDQTVTVAGAGDFRQALRQIAASGRKFISRGDESGTHQRERALWKAAGIAEDSSFIVPARAGMAETLSVASKQGAFALSDRGTFLVKRGDLDLAIVFQGDDELRNVYAVIEPAARDGVNGEGARALADFVRSPDGRALIGSFGVQTLGEPLVTPEE